MKRFFRFILWSSLILGLFAVSILAGSDPELAAKLKAYRQEMVEMVAEMKLED